MSGEVVRPFRWDVAKRSELGSLANVELPETYPGFEDDLFACAARLLALAGDSELVFVGRSPHALFDLLGGLLFGTSWQERLRLLNISLKWSGPPTGEQLKALYPYLADVGLEPHALARSKRTVALVDVVDYGKTFEQLVAILADWTHQVGAEWRAVARKLRIAGITWRTHTSPNTWRWQQHAEWVDELRLHEIKNVSAPTRLATALAADVPKTGASFHPHRWGDEEAAAPTHDREARQALALAVHLFDLGRTREARERFARELVGGPAMKERWFRSLVLEIRR